METSLRTVDAISMATVANWIKIEIESR
jgi:hypothetical protein